MPSESPESSNAKESVKPRRLMRWFRRGVYGLFLIALTAIFMFAVNGLWLANGESVETGQSEAMHPGSYVDRQPGTIKVMSWNIAKCFAHRGGMSFGDESVVRKRLRAMAKVINEEKPDLLFLSETLFDCSPCPVNQVEEVSDLTDLEFWAFGENYNFGLPFYRVSGGNAILSRFPLAAVANPDLPGRQPFWVTKNNRRALWCDVMLEGQVVRLCSIHTDSFSPSNNLEQTKAILSFASKSGTLLAGDFNARREEPSIQLVDESKRFVTGANGTVTFPGKAEEIDFIFAPKTWRVLSYRVLENDVSDHRPVVAVFELK